MKDQIRKLIEKGYTKEALELSLDFFSEVDAGITKKITVLSNQFNTITNDKRLGLGEKREEEARIVNALLEFIDQPDSISLNGQQQTKSRAQISETSSQYKQESTALSSKTSLLSWTGQFILFLGGLTALLAGYYFLVEKLNFQSWQALLIAAIPLVLTLLTHTLPAWLDARRKQRISTSSINGEIPPAGYFRLTPYEEKDKNSYKRADGIHEEVFHWIATTDSSILYLSGESGTGKSSLLNAYVLPKLRELDPPFQIVSMRGYHDPVEALVQSLTKPGTIWAERPSDELTPRKLLEQATAQLGSTRLLITFDQFEEFLILHDEEGRKDLETLLESLTTDPISGLSLMLIFRSDYFPQLNHIHLPPLEHGKNWLQVGLFTLRHSRAFLQSSGLVLSNDLIYHIATEAESMEGIRGLIRPITLNMFGIILERFAGRLPKGVEPGKLLRGYLEETINAKDIQKESGIIIKQMITSSGTKRPVSLDELKEATKISKNFLSGFMLRLAPRGIVRRIDTTNQVWEISHDFIAQLLSKIIYRWKTPNFPRILAWVAPITLVIWGITIFNLLPLSMQNAENNAISTLNDIYGFTIRPFEDGYSVKIEEVIDSISLYNASTYLKKINLKTLELSSNQVTHVSALAGLPNLTYLDLNSNQVTHISALAGLPNLTYLDLSSNQVADLNVLADLSNLTTLYLNNNQVIDLSALPGLSNLTALDLNNNQVTDISVLADLSNLTQLYLSSNQVTDISVLAGLSNLRILDLSSNQVTDISVLAGLSNLTTLYIDVTQVDDISAIESLRERSVQISPLLLK